MALNGENPKGKKADIEKKLESDRILYEQLAQRYLSEKRDYIADIKKWRSEAGMAARTMQMYVRCKRVS